MLDAAYNFAKTTISPFDSGATSATLTDPTRFLDPATKQYNCVVWCSSLYPNPVDDPNKEILRFTAKSGSVYTFTRAQEGTEAKDHNIEDEIYSVAIVLTEKMISDIQDELDDKEPVLTKGNLSGSGVITIDNTRQVIGGVATISHTDSSTVRHVTDTEKLTWSGKQDALGFTPEDSANKKEDLSDNSNTYYPTQKAVKDAVDTKLAITSKASSSEINTGTEDGKYVTPKGLADQTVLEKTSNKKTIITDSNTDYPTGRAVKTYADGLVVGTLNYRGAYDASGGTYPTTGGTGSGGAVMKGNNRGNRYSVGSNR